MWTYCRYFWFDPPLSFQLQSQELKVEDIWTVISFIYYYYAIIFYLLFTSEFKYDSFSTMQNVSEIDIS